jgi:hypothetical protein
MIWEKIIYDEALDRRVFWCTHADFVFQITNDFQLFDRKSQFTRGTHLPAKFNFLLILKL